MCIFVFWGGGGEEEIKHINKYSLEVEPKARDSIQPHYSLT